MRDRRSGQWNRGHPALRALLLGAVEPQAQRLCGPREGLRLVFDSVQMVMTSPLIVTGRPDRDAVFAYTSLCRAGEIVS